MQAIEAFGISKTYYNKTVLHSLDLTLPEGEFLGIVGPKGCGKSTAIDIMCGFQSPTRGRCSVFDTSVKDSRRLHKLIGIVNSKTNLFPHLSGIDNLMFIASLEGIDKTEAHNRASNLMKSLGIWDKHETRVSEYSEEQTALLSLARGVLHNPKILFYDRVGMGLSIAGEKAIINFLREINEQDGVTVCMACDEPGYAGELCSKFLVLRDGKALALGDYDTLAEEFHIPTLALIKSRKDVEGFKRNGEWLQKEIKSELDMPSLMRSAVLGGADIYSAEIRRPSFEDIYRKILKEEVKEDEGI